MVYYLFGSQGQSVVVPQHLVDLGLYVTKEIFYVKVLVVVQHLYTSVGIFPIFVLSQSDLCRNMFLRLTRHQSNHNGTASVLLDFAVFYTQFCHFWIIFELIKYKK